MTVTLRLSAAIALLVLSAAAWRAASAIAAGHWSVVEYESRGPNRFNRVLLNDRSGVVCELNRDNPSPSDPTLGPAAFWMCSRPPAFATPFMP